MYEPTHWNDFQMLIRLAASAQGIKIKRIFMANVCGLGLSYGFIDEDTERSHRSLDHRLLHSATVSKEEKIKMIVRTGLNPDDAEGMLEGMLATVSPLQRRPRWRAPRRPRSSAVRCGEKCWSW